MNLAEYIANHPERINNLDSSKKFYKSCGTDPIYIDNDRELIDITTLSAFIALHGGHKLRDETKAMETYLRGKWLRHPDDDPDRFSEAFEELKAHYKANRKSYPERAVPNDAMPFFVHPETAFGFMRHHLVSSEETYGMQLSLSSPIFPFHAHALILKAFEAMKKTSYLAWYLATENISMKWVTRRVELPEGGFEHAIDAYAYLPRMQAKHTRLELKTDAQGLPKLPSSRKLIKRVYKAGLLPGFDMKCFT